VSVGSPTPVLIAIDGPSGVGKGTVARRLAERLGLPYFDTGSMYRALALRVLEAGVDPADKPAALAALEGARVELAPPSGARGGGLAVRLDGKPVESRIRSQEVSEATSTLSAYPEVRRRLVELQRFYGRRHGGVMEGRDIGTVVFPDTPYKIFLDARPEVRLERRWRQLRESGREVSREEVAEEMRRRDERDTNREDSPLRWDATYHRVDTSNLSVDEVVERVLALIRSVARQTHNSFELLEG
jgi:cytidylate kinase